MKHAFSFKRGMFHLKTFFFCFYLQIHETFNYEADISGYYLPTPPLGQDMTQGQFLSGV